MIFTCRRANVSQMNTTFGLPANSLALPPLAEVAANPEQMQEKPLPLLFAHHARWDFPLEGETQLP